MQSASIELETRACLCAAVEVARSIQGQTGYGIFSVAAALKVIQNVLDPAASASSQLKDRAEAIHTAVAARTVDIPGFIEDNAGRVRAIVQMVKPVKHLSVQLLLEGINSKTTPAVP